MREMKDSGVEWIGEIPLTWDVLPLSRILTEHSSKNYGNIERNVLSLSYGRIIRRDVSENLGLLPESFETYNIVEPGQIVLRLTDLQNDQRSLRTGIVRERGIITSAYLTLTNNVESDNRFFHYLLHTYDIMKIIYNMGNGVRQNLKFSELAKLPTLLPPLEEQHRIADYLDAQCARIDRVIARQQEIIEKLKEYKLAVITEAVTKGLNPDVPMKDSGIEWIGEIPEGWEIIAFTRIAQVKSNLVDPALYQDLPQISPESIEKDSGHLISYVSVADSGVFSYNHYFYKGQILYSKIRPKLNKICIAPFDGLCSADMYPIETTENTRFILYCMLSQSFLSQVSMVTESRVKMPKINQSELGRILLAIPQDKQVEDEIASYLDVFCVSTDLVISQKLQLIDKITEYKKSLIYEVVTGKREV